MIFARTLKTSSLIEYRLILYFDDILINVFKLLAAVFTAAMSFLVGSQWCENNDASYQHCARSAQIELY